MKKVFLALACAGFLALSFTSCEKTCTCTTYIGDVSVGEPQEKTIKKGECSELNESITRSGVAGEITCE